jgi:exopolyphosphatase/guanosine-5'-triphosphate,3'-diphosphate pyrophosphatase
MTRIGVVDVGTNSVRLLVADGDFDRETEPLVVSGDPGKGSGLHDVERALTITRLGEGVDERRSIGEEPRRRTVAVIREYVERSRAAGAEHIRVIATSAVRDAANRNEFLATVRAQTGLDPDVLTGEQEARLGFAGATMSLAPGTACMVCDVGGGSTELVRGVSGGAIAGFTSLDIGSVRLTERHVRSDPPRTEELEAARANADAHVEEAARAFGSAAPARADVAAHGEGATLGSPLTDDTFVGLAGTITTVAAIDLSLPGYDRSAIHHCVLSRERIGVVRARLASMTSAGRRALPAMPRGREDVIVAGVVILEAVMDRFGFVECLVSESDILDGAALDLLRSSGRPSSPTGRV